MSKIILVIFDDHRANFGPMTDLRPAFELRTAVLSNRARIENKLNQKVQHLFVPKHLEQLTAERTNATVNQTPPNAPALLINGRFTALTHIDAIKSLKPNCALVQPDGQLIAANLHNPKLIQQLATAQTTPQNANLTLTTIDTHPLIESPADILSNLHELLNDDLGKLDLPTWKGLEPMCHLIGGWPVKVSHSAKILGGVLFDSSRGPILINDDAIIHPFTILRGPLYIGSAAVVNPHANLGPNVSIGPVCKVAGEITDSVFHGYSNKAHPGFLGHSLVGQWVNLGADTNVSNLKNTYGPVRVQLQPHQPPIDTNRTFHGPIIADHVRTAISTKILTGSVIHTAAVIALSSFPPKCVGPFTFLTDKGSQPAQFQPTLKGITRMMARRGFEPSQAEIARLKQLAETYTQSD